MEKGRVQPEKRKPNISIHEKEALLKDCAEMYKVNKLIWGNQFYQDLVLKEPWKGSRPWATLQNCIKRIRVHDPELFVKYLPESLLVSSKGRLVIERKPEPKPGDEVFTRAEGSAILTTFMEMEVENECITSKKFWQNVILKSGIKEKEWKNVKEHFFHNIVPNKSEYLSEEKGSELAVKLSGAEYDKEDNERKEEVIEVVHIKSATSGEKVQQTKDKMVTEIEKEVIEVENIELEQSGENLQQNQDKMDTDIEILDMMFPEIPVSLNEKKRTVRFSEEVLQKGADNEMLVKRLSDEPLTSRRIKKRKMLVKDTVAEPDKILETNPINILAPFENADEKTESGNLEKLGKHSEVKKKTENIESLKDGPKAADKNETEKELDNPPTPGQLMQNTAESEVNKEEKKKETQESALVEESLNVNEENSKEKKTFGEAVPKMKNKTQFGKMSKLLHLFMRKYRWICENVPLNVKNRYERCVKNIAQAVEEFLKRDLEEDECCEVFAEKAELLDCADMVYYQYLLSIAYFQNCEPAKNLASIVFELIRSIEEMYK